jgi:hypothetical protein
MVKEYGYVRCSTGEACRDICRRLFGTESKAVLNRVTDALKAIDPNVWLKAALSPIDGQSLVVFDSMRFGADYVFLQTQGFTMWRVEAPLAIRLLRMESRGQLVTPLDDDHPAETELDGYRFDRVFDNCGSRLDALYREIEKGLE